MTTARKLMLLAGGLAAVALSGCGETVPEHPSWVADVHPIMVARCVRCHDATLGESDPLSRMGARALGNFSYDSFSDFTNTDKGDFALSPDRIQSSDPLKAMPPPPAAKLADWQIDTITRFVNDNAQ